MGSLGTGASGGSATAGTTSSSAGKSAVGGAAGAPAAGGASATGGASGGSAGSLGATGGTGETSGAGAAGGTGATGGEIAPGGSAGSAAAGAAGIGGSSGGAGGASEGGTAGVGAASGVGGATAGGGAGGASAGASGGGTGGASAGCTVSPIDPAATQQTKNLLCYLYGIYGTKVLSGQQETSWSNPQGDIDFYVSTVNECPAILGGDYLYPSGTTSRAQAYWSAGGLTMLRYHMGAPPLADTYDNSKGTVSNFDDLTRAGTSLNSSLNSKLDYMANELRTLQNAGVAVILVPYHEVDQYAWFWWSKGTGPQFIELWKYTVNYINQTKGVHNVLWTLGFGHDGAMAAYNPGKAFIDLGGIDQYDKGTQPFQSHYESCKSVFGTQLPIPLHETGTIPQPSAMFPTRAPWLMWNVWATYQNTNAEGYTWNTPDTIRTAYEDSRTVTRETLPNLR